MNDTQDVLVTVGLAVFNGDNYLAEAIESILAQTHSNFELLISDNASTDRTAEICQHYAARDSRVRYHRNERNLGANPNFNRLVGPASGAFFKWMAHDDLLAPNCLEKSVEALQVNRNAVLCHTAVKMIDENGDGLCINENKLQGTRSSRVSDRLGAMILEDPNCQSIFSLFRTDVLRRTRLFHIEHNGDRLLMVEAAMQGPFVHINEPLFLNRVHSKRYTAQSFTIARDNWAFWYDTNSTKKRDFPLWRSYFEYFRLVNRQIDSSADRWRCYKHLTTWWFTNFNAARMLVEVLAAADPRLFKVAQAVKHRFFGTSIDDFRSRESKL